MLAGFLALQLMPAMGGRDGGKQSPSSGSTSRESGLGAQTSGRSRLHRVQGVNPISSKLLAGDTPIDILETDNIILSQIITALYFD